MLCCGCSRQLWLQPAHGPRGAVPGGPGLRPDAPAGAREARRRGLRPGHQARRPSAVVEAAPVLQPQDVGLLCADGGECSPPRGPCLRVAPRARATAASESLTGVTCSLAVCFRFFPWWPLCVPAGLGQSGAHAARRPGPLLGQSGLHDCHLLGALQRWGGGAPLSGRASGRVNSGMGS